MEQHFVSFYSPGTFVAEVSDKPVDSWDVERAKALAAEVTERYGATPYGFRFTTRSRGDNDLDSKVTATSPMYYLNGRVRTIEDVRKRNDPKDSILLSNMESNGYDRVVTTTKGYRWTQGNYILAESSAREDDRPQRVRWRPEKWVSNLHPAPAGSDGWMALFHIYVDESGKLQQNPDYTCICGYLADGPTWETFSHQWNRCRLRWDVPALHMSKIMKSSGPNTAYKADEWDVVRARWGNKWEDIRNEMLVEFASIISSLAMVGLGIVVDAVAYKKLRKDGSPIADEDPNVFAFHHVIMDGLAKIQRVTALGTLSIIVDDDPEYAWGYYNLTNGLRNHENHDIFACVRDRLHGLCYGDDKAYPGLQAADLLAWCSRRYMIDRKQDEDHLPSNLLRLLTFDGLHQPSVYSEAILMQVSEGTIAALEEAK